MADRVDSRLTCHACEATFSYRLVDAGFNESAHGYCNQCGRTLLLEVPWQDPKYTGTQPLGPIVSAVEATLAPCPCGGSFSAAASPRCPSCRVQLSALLLRAQIEANAPGASAGWRWQNSWQGTHAIIINDQQTTGRLPSGA